MPNHKRLCLLLGLLSLFLSCAKTPEQPQGLEKEVSKPRPPQGWDVSGGGNAFAAEFKDIGRTLIRRLKTKFIKEVASISVQAFEEVLEAATVITTDLPLQVQGTPVDALNFPQEMKIQLSLVHWVSSMDHFQKRRLVVHEVLGLMRKDDSGYRLATQILKSPGLSHVKIRGVTIEGEIAKTIIEKMIWQEAEIFRNGERTTYRSQLFHGEKRFHTCNKFENRRDAERTRFECELSTDDAVVRDDGSVAITLREHDPLWRLFGYFKDKDFERPSFDYGTVKGDSTESPHKAFRGLHQGIPNLVLYP